MKLLVNRDIRRFFWEISIVLLLLLICGFIFSQAIIQNFKEQLLAHDYEIAGYLLEQGESPSAVSEAFAAVKTEMELSRGRELLQSLGYSEETDERLLSYVNLLLIRYRVVFAISAILFGILILSAFFLYFNRQQHELERAGARIRDFMDGNTAVRLESEKEGSLSCLFASVNEMAASLNAHIEAEKQGREFLKTTISDISHQLKTPLAALRMYNEIMQAESSDEKTVRKFSTKAERAMEHMENLIRNLLKLTKLDAGVIVLNKKEHNIQAFMEELAYGFETRTVQEQKSIILDGSADTMLFCDRDWLMEAISNLVKNALDHTEAGGEIRIAWKETPAVIKILVGDNGRGIHPEDIHHIFKRFYRSRFSQDRQGIGLGLSLTKSIVEAHNGTVTVDSALGRGSTFTMDFLKLTNL